MSFTSKLQATWNWLAEDKNRQVLLFVGGGLAATLATLSQLGFFAVKPSVVINKPAANAPIAATPAPAASAPVVASAPADLAARLLLDDIARKKEQAERESRQEEREAWQIAQQLGTIPGYQAYLSDYPNGRHARFALAAIDKLRNPVMNLPASTVVSAVVSAVPDVPSAVKPAKSAHAPDPHRKPTPKPAARPAHSLTTKPAKLVTAPTGKPGRIIVQCSEGTKLYVDGLERGRITTNLFGTFTVKLTPGKHAILLTTNQGILQQDMELQSGQTLRINPPMCGN